MGRKKTGANVGCYSKVGKAKRKLRKDLEQYKTRNRVIKRLGFDSYRDYLASDLWKSIRSKVFRKAQGRCQTCRTRPATEVHHLKYWTKVLVGTKPELLIAVCRRCHQHAEFDNGRKTTLNEANRRLGA